MVDEGPEMANQRHAIFLEHERERRGMEVEGFVSYSRGGTGSTRPNWEFGASRYMYVPRSLTHSPVLI